MTSQRVPSSIRNNQPQIDIFDIFLVIWGLSQCGLGFCGSAVPVAERRRLPQPLSGQCSALQICNGTVAETYGGDL
jgi:hypothetical protein